MASATARPLVLVADDYVDGLELVTDVLTLAGLDVVGVHDGNRVQDVTVAKNPVLIVLDLHLPGARGDEITRRLKADPRTSAIPVVILTADQTEQAQRASLGAGADAFVLKPILPARLVEVVGRFVPVRQPEPKGR